MKKITVFSLFQPLILQILLFLNNKPTMIHSESTDVPSSPSSSFYYEIKVIEPFHVPFFFYPNTTSTTTSSSSSSITTTTNVTNDNDIMIEVEERKETPENLIWLDTQKTLSDYRKQSQYFIQSLQHQYNSLLRFSPPYSLSQGSGLDSGSGSSSVDYYLNKLLEKIENVAEFAEHDYEVLSELLSAHQKNNMKLVKAIEYSYKESSSVHHHYNPNQESHETITMQNHETPPLYYTQQKQHINNNRASYDSTIQIMTHLIRDWSFHGRKIRDSINHWAIHKFIQYYLHNDCLNNHHQTTSTSTSSSIIKILIPGAGLGRLAFDFATFPFHEIMVSRETTHTHKIVMSVEANDCSYAMAAVSNHIFNTLLQHNKHNHINNNTNNNDTSTMKYIHPFLLDYDVNQIDWESRIQKIPFPSINSQEIMSRKDFIARMNAIYNNTTKTEEKEDSHTTTNNKESPSQFFLKLHPNASLSYTIGDFVPTYSSSSFYHHHGYYNTIITCFFIDTATNIFEYLSIIDNILTKGGIWINVGPLQWHSNSLMKPTVNELKKIIETYHNNNHHQKEDCSSLNDDKNNKPSFNSTTSSSTSFEILEWFIDSQDEPVPYRSDQEAFSFSSSYQYSSQYNTHTGTGKARTRARARATKMEAYVPLRFVVRKK